MARFTFLRKHLGAIPPSILLTNIAASAWDRPIRGHLKQTTICQLRRSSQAVPTALFGDRRLPLLPSAANKNRSYKPAPWPTPLRRSKYFYRLEDYKPGAMAYAIVTGRRIPQLGGQRSRSYDPSGRPCCFIHASAPRHPPPFHE